MPSLSPRRAITRLRLARRVAAGMSARRAAVAEGLAGEELESILGDPEFAELVEACRTLDTLSEDEAVERLVRLARFVIEDALARGHVMVGLYVLREHERGRNPARSLATSAVASRRRAIARAAKPPAPPPNAPAPPRPRACRPHAADRAAWSAAARLRGALVQEAVLRSPVAVLTRAIRAAFPVVGPPSCPNPPPSWRQPPMVPNFSPNTS
jgi:hypothetical protein